MLGLQFSPRVWHVDAQATVLTMCLALPCLQPLYFSSFLPLSTAPDCLWVSDYTSIPALASSTNVSLTLNLSSWQPEPRPLHCEGQSRPPILYHIHYRLLSDPDSSRGCGSRKETCKMQDSYNPIVTLKDLEPFSAYHVQISSSNNFMHSEGQSTELGPHKVFWTEEGSTFQIWISFLEV